MVPAASSGVPADGLEILHFVVPAPPFPSIASLLNLLQTIAHRWFSNKWKRLVCTPRFLSIFLREDTLTLF
jgi:hypothetical protein